MHVCPSCGEESPERFRLCGYCGTPLSPVVTPHEVRKTVTIVFSDLQGSTNLGEALDSESLREVMTRYFDAMRAELEHHGGTIEKFIGDAVMAVFGLPKLHEDDALRAVRASAGMQRALEELNDELEQRYGIRLVNRTGVNTGEVVAGDPTAGQRLVTGDAVNVAARLEQAAGACEVLLGELTHRLVRDHVEVEPVEPLQLKGKSRPVPAYRLVSMRTEAARSRRTNGVFVGRAAELEQLTTAWETVVRERRCDLVTVIGEPGVGKTRLIQEFVTSVEPDALVLRGRCLPYGDGITFWPLVELVRQAAGIAERDSADEARTKLAALARSSGGDVTDRVAAAIGLSLAPFSVEELFWGVRKLLEELARQRPLVVIFEDIHWAEPTFLQLIEHLTAATEDAPLLLLSPARHELVERLPEWGTKAGAVRVELAPLSGGDTAEIVENLLGGAGLDERVGAQIVTAADGNPLFVEQLLSMMIDEGYLRREDGRWLPVAEIGPLAVPPTIHALLATRLDQLEATEQAVIEPASVVGYEFQVDAVRYLEPEQLRDSLPAHLAALTEKQLVGPDRSRPPEEETYRFRHILIRDTAYERLLKRSRATLHERFVEWADEVNRDRAAEYEEILGYHLEQAYRYLTELGPLDDRGRAVGVDAAGRLGSAGLRALARGDMSAARNLLVRAADLRPRDDPARLELLPSVGEALFQTGEFSEAEAVLEEAIVLAAESGSRQVEAHAKLVRLLVRLHIGETAQWGEEAIVDTNEAIAIFDELGDHTGLARAWRYLGYAHGNACRWDDMALALARALDYARLANDARQQAWSATGYAAALLHGPTPVGDAIERCESIVEPIAHDRQAQGVVLAYLAELEAMRARFDQGRALAGRANSLLEDLGAHVKAAYVSLHAGRVEVLAGNLTAAHAELLHGYETLERLGDKYSRPTVAARLAKVLYEQGLVDEAERYASEAEALAAGDDIASQALWRSARAKILAGRGLSEAAVELADEAVELLARTDATLLHAEALHDRAEVLHASGREDEARSALEGAARLAESKGSLADAQRSRTLLQALRSKPLVG